MADLETLAIALGCRRHGIRLMRLDGVSDGVSELQRFENCTEYLTIIDGRIAGNTDHLLNAYLKACETRYFHIAEMYYPGVMCSLGNGAGWDR